VLAEGLAEPSISDGAKLLRLSVRRALPAPRDPSSCRPSRVLVAVAPGEVPHLETVSLVARSRVLFVARASKISIRWPSPNTARYRFFAHSTPTRAVFPEGLKGEGSYPETQIIPKSNSLSPGREERGARHAQLRFF